MICPSWPELLRHRLVPGLDEPVGWPEAVRHLAACPACRRAALSLDPTLLFAGARALVVPDDEIAALRDTVRALRRLRGVDRRARPSAPARRSVLAAGLALLALLLVPIGPADETAVAPPAARAAAAPGAPPARIENLDSPGARVYQWASEEVAVVLVVDESLDV